MDVADMLARREQVIVSRTRKTEGAVHHDDPQHHSSFSPISILPEEIISYIFEAFVASGDPPWQLALVSNQWKELALGTPRLWSNILVTNSKAHCKSYSIGGEIGQVSARGNFQLCQTSDDLEKALVRSGATLLNVSIQQTKLSKPIFVKAWSQILGKPVSDRLQDLFINVPTSTTNGLEWTTISLESTYSYLTSIDLRVPLQWGQVLIPGFLGAAGRMIAIRGRMPDNLEVSSFDWRNIQSFDFQMTPPHVVNRLCTHLTNLEKLQGLPDDWPNSSTPLTTFKHLSVLELIGCTSHYMEDLRRLSLPTLTELDLQLINENRTANNPASHQENPLPVWKLPSLIKLSIEVEDQPEFSRWLASVDMPCLQLLMIDIFGGDRNDSFPAGVVYPNLHFLYLVADRAESYFIQALEAAPNISEVSMSNAKLLSAKDRGSDLLTRLSLSGSEMLCPKIAKLTLNGGDRGVLGSREGLEPLIKRVVESRAGVLQKFAVEWRNDGSPRRKLVDHTKES
ncbi:hypothetical protein FRC17_000551 [Serendipita sp. 399]|nr:hypothetical protein FRC17_000551 [Serendipita sp. 399]